VKKRRFSSQRAFSFGVSGAYMRWSIRYQLLIPLLILLLGVVGISTWTGIASADRARKQVETQVRDIARTVLKETTIPKNKRALQLMRGLSEAEYLLDEGTGELITTLDLDQMPEGLPKPTSDAETLQLGPRVIVNGKAYLCNGVHHKDQAFTLYIFYPESLWRDALWEAVRPSLILGVFGGLASLALALGVAHRLSRRVQELERRTRLIAAGDFSPMPLPRRNDELRDLSRSVNDMAQRLAQFQETVQKTERFRLLGQVSGGLAHQLRNGVTGARLAVQLHARECSSQAEAEALGVALRQLALVEAHLKRFLELGNNTQHLHQAHALAGLLEEAIALLRPQCRHARIDLRWQPPPASVTVHADAGQLGHLFLNVIGNAIEAAGPGGWVSVCVQVKDRPAADPLAVIEVADSGPGPASEVAQRLFEPFVTGKPEGVGLGLAVARQVAEVHGGSLHWHREPDRTCFEIELPVQLSKTV
jgi:signal transduction histidine kinase